MRYSLCNHWEFTEQWSDAFCRVNLLTAVRCVCPIPAVSCRPLRRPSDYEMVCGYRRTLTVPDAPRVFLRF